VTRGLRFFAALCLGFCISAVADDGADGGRLRAVKQMLTKLDFGAAYIEVETNKFIDSRMTSPRLSKDLDWLGKQLSPSEAVDRCAPVYAEYLSAAEADELRQFFASPLGNKIWTVLLEQTLTGKSSLVPPLSGEEKRRADIYVTKSRAWRALNDAKKDIARKIASVSAIWGQELQQRRYAGFARQLADTLDDTAPQSEANETRESRADEHATDQETLPGFFPLIQDINRRTAVILNEFASQTKDIDLASVLAPGTLTSREGIRSARQKLGRYEAEFSKRQREISRLNDEYVRRLHALGGTENTGHPFILAAEKGMENGYADSMRMEENQRRFLGILQKILNFAEERLGAIHVEDQQLAFSDASDLRLYESLRQQIQIEARIEAEIAREQRAIREKAVRELRESGAIPDAAKSRPPDG